MLPTDRIELTEAIARLALAEMLKTFPVRWGVSYNTIASAAGLNIVEVKHTPLPSTYKIDDFEGGWEGFVQLIRGTLQWLENDGLVDLISESSFLYARPTREGLRLVGKDILAARPE